MEITLFVFLVYWIGWGVGWWARGRQKTNG